MPKQHPQPAKHPPILTQLKKVKSATRSSLLKKESDADDLKALVQEGKVVQLKDRYFLRGKEPTVDSEIARIEILARTSVSLVKESNFLTFSKGVKSLPPTLSALEKLVNVRKLLRLPVSGEKKLGFVYLHADHARKLLGDGARTSQASVDKDKAAAVLNATVEKLREKTRLSSLWISDVIAESGLPKEVVHEWMLAETQAGRANLNESDWPSARPEQREARVDYLNRPRLLFTVNT